MSLVVQMRSLPSLQFSLSKYELLNPFSSAKVSPLQCIKNILQLIMICFLSEFWYFNLNGYNLDCITCVQSVWVIARGVQKEQDEAKLRFAAAEVYIAL